VFYSTVAKELEPTWWRHECCAGCVVNCCQSVDQPQLWECWLSADC